MKKTALFFLFQMSLLCLAVFPTKADGNFLPAGNSADRDLARYESDILISINKERRKSGLREFFPDGELQRIARRYSEKMARERFFSHSDRNGENVLTRVRNSRILTLRKVGENLFFSTTTNDLINVSVRGWLKSSSHRKNMLDAVYNFTGIGVAQAKDGSVYVTQIFLAR